MNGSTILSEQYHFVITVSTTPSNCVQLNNSNVGGMIISGEMCNLTDNCLPPVEFCATGVTVSGNVTAPGQIYDCPNTENHGIQGAEISITTLSDESCNTSTSNDGSYSCTFCDEGPFEICVNTVCEDPCGVDEYDLTLLTEYLLGLRPFTKELWIIGDVDGDGKTRAGDLTVIRKELLKIDTISVRNWCKFIPASDINQLPTPSNGNR